MQGGLPPETRTDYWAAKFDRNVARDAKARDELAALGWKVVVVRECNVKDREAVGSLLLGALSRDGPLPSPHETRQHLSAMMWRGLHLVCGASLVVIAGDTLRRLLISS